MNETDAIHWHLHRYGAILSRQIDRLYNALEELQRTTLLLLDANSKATETMIDQWLEQEQFAVDSDGFLQSLPLLADVRRGQAPPEAISISWGAHLKDDPIARRHLYSHRTIGPHLRHIHQRLGNIGWIYYQDAANIALQHPFIDQVTAIPADFDWRGYHTYTSVCPANNPERHIRWTPPTIDYAGEGLILSVSIPVWQAECFIGLWSIDLPLRFLYQDFAASTPFAEQEQWITDGQGQLLLHHRLQAEIDPHQGQVLLHSLADLGGDWATMELSSILHQPKGEFTVGDASQRAWFVAHLHIPLVDWVLFCAVPEASLEVAASQRLQAAFRQLGEGHFGSVVETSSSSALITTLVEEFNRMSRRLEQAGQDRQRIEQQLRQAQKMEAIGRLAGGVAHDYNNMINVIMGYAELALERVEVASPLHRDLTQILEAARRSMEITRQLLAFARRQTVAPRTVDLNHEVQGLLKMLKRLIGEAIELHWHPGTDTGLINIDPSQIDQILVNLCINARDAIDGVGKIILESGMISFDEEYCHLHPGFVPGEYVQLAISDNGSGMESDVLKHIFEPFFTTKEQGKGTGLGLATVYGIVKQNGGFINAYSEPTTGSTFRLYFPCHHGTAVQRQAQPASPLPPTQGETILVVEDEPQILELARRILTQRGYTVITADTPDLAVAMARRPAKIDLLLTDVVLPTMNGRELARQIRALHPRIAILYMSGYTANIIAKHGVLDAGVLLLQKPFSQRELTAKVHQALHDSEARP